jgi:hypothetical protein
LSPDHDIYYLFPLLSMLFISYNSTNKHQAPISQVPGYESTNLYQAPGPGQKNGAHAPGTRPDHPTKPASALPKSLIPSALYVPGPGSGGPGPGAPYKCNSLRDRGVPRHWRTGKGGRAARPLPKPANFFNLFSEVSTIFQIFPGTFSSVSTSSEKCYT